jgi:hypothetical protein
MVPLWDFQAPKSMLYKDTSAAAVAASGLAELDFYAPGRGYLQAAIAILTSLTQWVRDTTGALHPRLHDRLIDAHNTEIESPAALSGPTSPPGPVQSNLVQSS